MASAQACESVFMALGPRICRQLNSPGVASAIPVTAEELQCRESRAAALLHALGQFGQERNQLRRKGVLLGAPEVQRPADSIDLHRNVQAGAESPGHER